MILALGGFLVMHPIGMAVIVGYAVYFLANKPQRSCERCRHRWTPRTTDE